MNGFTQILGDWHLYALAGAYWIFSNAVSALPMPVATSSTFYGWLFKFANGLAANVSRAIAGKLPGTTGDAGMQQEEVVISGKSDTANTGPK